MSRLFEALCRSELERSGYSHRAVKQSNLPTDLLQGIEDEALGFEQIRSLRPVVRSNSRLVALTDVRSLGAEKFRFLSTRLKYLQEQRQIKKVLVTSSITDEGKSVVVANLAITLAQRTKQKILLLEGDLRQPGLARLFGQDRLKGLSELLQSDEPATKFLYCLNGLRLWFLPAGVVPEQPLELLQSKRLAELLSQFTGWFDWILIDSPPLLPLADASWWSRLADGVLLVVRENQTPKTLLQKALETLDNSTLLGVVLNEATGKEHRYYGQHYTKQAVQDTDRNKRRKTEASL